MRSALASSRNTANGSRRRAAGFVPRHAQGQMRMVGGSEMKTRSPMPLARNLSKSGSTDGRTKSLSLVLSALSRPAYHEPRTARSQLMVSDLGNVVSVARSDRTRRALRALRQRQSGGLSGSRECRCRQCRGYPAFRAGRSHQSGRRQGNRRTGQCGNQRRHLQRDLSRTGQRIRKLPVRLEQLEI